MNRKTAQILTLAALSSFSAASMAFNTRVMPKTETQIALPAPKTTIETKIPVTTDINVVRKGLNVQSDIVLPSKTAEAKPSSKVFQCDVSLFDRFVAGTSLNAAAIRDAQARGVIHVDNKGCDVQDPESVVNYPAESKEIAGETVLCSLRNGIESKTVLADRADIGGGCMAEAKQHHGDKTATKANQIPKWMKVHEKCNIVL